MDIHSFFSDPHFESRLLEVVSVPRETAPQIARYVSLLQQWNTRINLVANAEDVMLWERHMRDSLQLIKHIPDPSATIIDLGSGAGFPGIPLAICGCHSVHLIESDRRKTIFLQEVARALHLPVTIHHSRIESLSNLCGDIITARACASLAQLLNWTVPFLMPHTFCLFPKGKNWAMELEEARKQWQFECEPIPSLTDPDARILKVSDIRPR